MDGNTYIKLYRKFLEWEWYQDSNTKLVFIHLLILAEWKDVKRKGVELKRGQCLVTEASLSGDLGMSRQEIRTALRHLISTNEISKQATRVVTNGKTNSMTLITIEKYSTYQGVDNFSNPAGNQGNDQPLTKHQPSTNQPTYSMKNNKNYNNSKNNNARARVSHGDGVSKFTKPTIQEVKAYCMERGNDIDPERFVDFYEAKGWMIGKNKMKDWRAAVRSWERNRASKPVEKIQREGRLDWIDEL